MRSIKIISLSVLLSLGAYQASASQWSSVSADSLVKLPANLIEKRIQQDFRMSPLAEEVLQLEKDINQQSQSIKAIQELLHDAESNEMIDERVDLVQMKSSFLDSLQAAQALRQEQLDSKTELYQEVLEKLYQQADGEQSSSAYELKISQQAARARMEKVMQQVDDALLGSDMLEQSPYAKEFASNLQKIEQLKQTISQHKANLSATIDGEVVSTQEYIRQLLMTASTEQSLLDQESLMLSYMAKIVALDAQSLEFTISELQEESSLTAVPVTTPASSVELFL